MNSRRGSGAVLVPATHSRGEPVLTLEEGKYSATTQRLSIWRFTVEAFNHLVWRRTAAEHPILHSTKSILPPPHMRNPSYSGPVLRIAPKFDLASSTTLNSLLSKHGPAGPLTRSTLPASIKPY